MTVSLIQNFEMDIYIILILIFISSSLGELKDDPCTMATSCEECMGFSAECLWCQDPKFEDKDHERFDSIKRCGSRETHKTQNCFDLINPEKWMKIVQEDPVQMDSEGNARHISPQKVSLALRVGQSEVIDLKYLEAEQKALDFYYLLDVSYTMKANRKTVTEQANNLQRELKKISNVKGKGIRIRFGLGSFIDKPIYPFSTLFHLRKSNDGEVPPYGFKHHLTFDEDAEKFVKGLKNIDQSSNYDNPEGQFDALMQAIACEDIIGWEKQKPHRRLLVLATDGTFHIAGDGKLAGILQPNDEKCHMERNGNDYKYTHSTLQDYPSISQIMNKVADVGNLVVLFAVPKYEEEVYRNLAALNPSLFKTITLTKDSNNIVEAITSEYRKIQSTVEIEERIIGETLDVKIQAKCLGESSFNDKKQCNGIKYGTDVAFKIQVTLKKCPNPANARQKVIVSPLALKGESLEIEVESLCSCATCTANALPNVCNKTGSISQLGSCGICQCKSEYQGRFCHCAKSQSKSIDQKNCIDKEGEVCGGKEKGVCFCGSCDCNKPRFDGDFCEIDRDKVCGPILNGTSLRCSGRGKCHGKDGCECTGGFTSKFCQCSPNPENCIDPWGQICGGNVEECKCKIPQEEEYKEQSYKKECICERGGGDFCDAIERSGSVSRCQDESFQSCLECHLNLHYSNSEDDGGRCLEKCKIGNKSTPIEAKFIDGSVHRQRCTKDVRDGCSIHWNYAVYRAKVELMIERPKKGVCKVNILLIILSVVGGILAFGLVALISWKIFIHFFDKREFQKFERQKANAKWGARDNPLYSPPTSNFENPVFKG